MKKKAIIISALIVGVSSITGTAFAGQGSMIDHHFVKCQKTLLLEDGVYETVNGRCGHEEDMVKFRESQPDMIIDLNNGSISPINVSISNHSEIGFLDKNSTPWPIETINVSNDNISSRVEDNIIHLYSENLSKNAGAYIQIKLLGQKQVFTIIVNKNGKVYDNEATNIIVNGEVGTFETSPQASEEQVEVQKKIDNYDENEINKDGITKRQEAKNMKKNLDMIPADTSSDKISPDGEYVSEVEQAQNMKENLDMIPAD